MVKNKEQVYISVIIYAHNSKDSLGRSLNLVLNLLDERFEKFEIIVVNDASSDDTENKIKQSNIGKITLINLANKHGLEIAMQVGLDFSIGDFVIEIDSSEISYDINYIYELYKKSCEGYDIVSLEPKGTKKLTSSFFYLILNQFSGNDRNFNTQVACILTRRAINAISTIKDKTRYRKLLHVFTGYRKATIEVPLKQKVNDSYTIAEKLSMSSDILFSFTNLGIKVNIYIALFFFSFSFFLGSFAVYQYFSNDQLIEGWTTIMLFLSLGFSGIFIVLAILNKYFSIVLKEIRNSPQYLIKNIERF